MMLNLRTKLIAQLVTAFFISVVAGTLSHEAGHALGAQRYSKPGSIHITYESTWWSEKENLNDTIFFLSEKKDRSIAEQQQYERIVKKFAYRELRATAAGPLLTILLGTIGCILLFILKPAGSRQSLSFGQWACVFLSLCWLRPVYMFFAWAIIRLSGGRFRADEGNIAEILECPEWLILVPAGLAGIIIAWYVTFIYIPRPVRNSFIAAAIIGCPLGYFLWFYVLGPVILP